jgi:type II secretory pathway pseudopilin PulG
LRGGYGSAAGFVAAIWKGTLVTIVLLIIIAAIGGLVLVYGVRKRAERAAAEALLARSRAARRSRVPEVSSNLKGVTASQTIEPVKPERTTRAA